MGENNLFQTAIVDKEIFDAIRLETIHLKKNEKRYFVDHGNVGYIIRDTQKTLPLPFTFFSKHIANIVCERFNEYGHREVAEFYYMHKIAGNGYNISYKDWIDKNGDMFK